MPDVIRDRQVFSLKEVADSIGRTLKNRYSTSFWVKAEMNKLNLYQHSGHCYPDLVQKADGKVIAQMRAVLWAGDFMRLNALFRQLTGEPLHDGIQLLFRAAVLFDANYGLSLQILDIDPVYLMGELEREKLENIQKLKAEGIYDKNKRVRMPMLPKRVAVISVSTSKGFVDFEQVLSGAAGNYKIEYMLFPSLLQGEKAAQQIVYQLQRIQNVAHHFDVVAIIRGGGGEVGLAAFNDYSLAKAICLFPLPVFTGIGHATNTTVSEMVAHTQSITPTNLANTLLGYFQQYEAQLMRTVDIIGGQSALLNRERQMLHMMSLKLSKAVSGAVALQQNRLGDMAAVMRLLAHANVHQAANRIQQVEDSFRAGVVGAVNDASLKLALTQHLIQHASAEVIQTHRTAVENLERLAELMRPEKLLKRGFSITMHNGKPLTSATAVRAGDVLQTQLFDGVVESVVNNQNIE